MHQSTVPWARTDRAQLVPVALVALLLAACGGGTSSASASVAGGPTTVEATLTEFKVELSQTEFPAGDVTFVVTNDGDIPHEFVVFATDLAVDALPLASAGDVVDESDPAVDPLGEVEDVAPGATKEFTIPLEAGTYVGICNVETHYGAGMTVELTVN